MTQTQFENNSTWKYLGLTCAIIASAIFMGLGGTMKKRRNNGK